MKTINRFIGIFTNPTESFEDIKEKPDFIKPGAILIGIFTILFLLQIDLIRDTVLSQLKMTAEMNSELEITDSLVSGMVNFSVIAGVLAAVINPLFKGLLVYGISALLNGKAKLKQSLSVMLYSYIVIVLGEIIVTGLTVVTGNPYINLSPAMLLSEFNPLDIKYIMLSFLDVFLLGYLAITIHGMKVIHKYSYKKASIAVLVPTLVYILMVVVPTLLQ